MCPTHHVLPLLLREWKIHVVVVIMISNIVGDAFAVAAAAAAGAAAAAAGAGGGGGGVAGAVAAAAIASPIGNIATKIQKS